MSRRSSSYGSTEDRKPLLDSGKQGGDREEKAQLPGSDSQTVGVQRHLTLMNAIAVILGSSAGSGIFISPSAVTRQVSLALLFLMVFSWLLLLSPFFSFFLFLSFFFFFFFSHLFRSSSYFLTYPLFSFLFFLLLFLLSCSSSFFLFHHLSSFTILSSSSSSFLFFFFVLSPFYF